ncbi:MAG TPA: hypothetical protein VHY79_15175 [Rhizomicrobium sp.]|jgi:hypothetical protein|nr:hypothetical protein [Rhizomicrobium sp.]
MAGQPVDNSQGNSEPKLPPQPQWDWSEDGARDSTKRADDKTARQQAEQKEARAEALRAELGDLFRRALEAERINTERRVRLELEREGRTAVLETAMAPFSRNIPPAARDPHAGAVRIGGRIVEG